MIRFAPMLAAVVLAAGPAIADEIHPTSTIEAVTVYPLGASVTRRVPLSLPAGTSLVEIDDLPAGIETDSLKVDGSADGPIEIGSVETRVVPADAASDPKRQALLDAIQALNDRLDRVGDRMAALKGRQRFVDKLIETTPAGFGKALGEGGNGVDHWAQAAETIGAQLAEIGEAVRALRIDERGLRADLDDKKKALAELPPPRDHLVARIEIAAEVANSGSLTIGYRVPDARWLPRYDAMLDTGDAGGSAKLAIVRRAEVTQATGEDWAGVALSLSTARPSGGTAAPSLAPMLAAFRPKPRPLAAGRSYDAAPAPAMEKAIGIMDEAAAPPPAPARFVEAAADFGDFRAVYRVPGKVTVESGVGARGLRIDSETVSAELEVRAVPALAAAAYLHARFTAKSGAPFLAGQVSLFRDGAFVGAGRMPFANAGHQLDLGFGVDDLVRVTRTALDRATGEHGILSSRRTDARRYRMTVENLHRQAMTITVLDRMPYAEDESITVERLDDATRPTVENVDDQRGILAWTYDYKPGETRDIENAYQVSWPADQDVVLAD